MKRLGKWLIKRNIVQWVLVSLLVLWLRFVFLTSKVTCHIPDESKPYVSGEKQAVFCFWHGRMIMHPFIKPNRPTHALASRHRDGGLISAVLERFDIALVRGSTHKGGAGALRELKHVAASGASICITPDGPRGPAHIAAKGTAYVACGAGLPVICSAFSATRARRLGGWDRLMIPLPFSHIIYALSPLFYFDASKIEDRSYITQVSATLSDTTNMLMARCDEEAGVAA